MAVSIVVPDVPLHHHLPQLHPRLVQHELDTGAGVSEGSWLKPGATGQGVVSRPLDYVIRAKEETLGIPHHIYKEK